MSKNPGSENRNLGTKQPDINSQPIRNFKKMESSNPFLKTAKIAASCAVGIPTAIGVSCLLAGAITVLAIFDFSMAEFKKITTIGGQRREFRFNPIINALTKGVYRMASETWREFGIYGGVELAKGSFGILQNFTNFVHKNTEKSDQSQPEISDTNLLKAKAPTSDKYSQSAIEDREDTDIRPGTHPTHASGVAPFFQEQDEQRGI